MSARARAARALHPFGAFALCAVLALAFAAVPAQAGWQTFGIADGLVKAELTAVAQDSSENLWFGSTVGASHYDGVAFRTFTSADGLITDNVQAIFTDHLGRVWFGTPSGVTVLDHGQWITYQTAQGLANDDVRDIFEDSAGRLWFATNGGGASRFDGTTWTTFTTADGLAANELTSIYQDRAGVMWFGTLTAGVSRWNGTTWTTYNSANTGGGLADNSVRCIHGTRDGLLWVGMNFGGLARFNGTAWNTINAAGSIGLNQVNDLTEDRNGALWVASNAGLARFDGLAWRSFTTAEGLSGNELRSVTIDNVGNVWLATDKAGANRYDGESWASFTVAGMSSGNQAVFEDTAGVVWVGTETQGAARYDRSSWSNVTNASTSGGLASDNVTAIVQDSTGSMWFGTSAVGVSRFNGTIWQTFTTASGLAGDAITALARDSSGAVWVGTFAGGLSRYDGTTWTSHSTANGLPSNRVRSLYIDPDGSVWCGTSLGVAHLVGAAWTVLTTANGLANNAVTAILRDRANVMWFGTNGGLSRYDGTTWQTFTDVDGLGSSSVRSLSQTADGALWVGTNGGGVSRFDGSLWHTYRASDGLINNSIRAAVVEHSGNLWFAAASGVSQFEYPRVPPQTVITVPPPALSPNRLQTVPFVAAFRQSQGIEFSTALDLDAWSPWTREAVWVGRDLVDGVHTLHVRTRNALNFVDPTPATATFEIAATPPIPILSSPAFREPARDTLQIRGVATALRFRSLKVQMRPSGTPGWDPPTTVTVAESSTPINGIIGKLGTRDYPDGDYDMRLTVEDTLGLVGYAQVTFVIDNAEPFAAQTTPAQVSALAGGDVFTTNREAHVYIPPRGLPRDAVVSITPLLADNVPDQLPDGATLVDPGVSIALIDLQNSTAVPLEKTAILDREISIATISFPAGSRLSFYYAGADNVWKRIGGTLDEATNRFATTFISAGNFAIYAAPADATIASPLALSLTPRVLTSRGATGTPTVKIAFTMAQAGTARVTIHNKAGRLLRVVMDGQPLAPGTNLVNWDGRDTDAHDVPPGLYFVTVEALGDRSTSTVGVVR